MSQSSREQSYPQPPQQPDDNRTPQKNNTWIYLSIIAVLLGINGYLFFNKSKLNEQVQAAEMNYAKADSSRAVVQQDYDAALARLDDLVSQNSHLDSVVNDQNGEVARLKKEIDKIVGNNKASQAELARAHTLIKQLNGKVSRYEERIAALEGDNKRLAKENEVVSSQRDAAIQETGNLRKAGAVLVATNIRMSPMNERRGGTKETETERARKVDFLRIVFDIAENRIADSGPKELFFRVIGPDGNLLSNASYGSGVTTDYKDQQLPYTFSKQINLETGKPIRNLTADWKQDKPYAKGNYIIEIYNSGYMIGNDGVTLK